MKVFYNFIFFYLLNFVIIFWVEKYFLYKISRRDENDIILHGIVLFSKEKFYSIVSIMFKIIFLLLLYIWLYLMNRENILVILSFTFFLLFLSFYIKIKNSQLSYHKEILKDYWVILFSMVVFFLNLFALNNMFRNDSYAIKLITFFLVFPSLFVLNLDKTKQNFYFYISKGELYFLDTLDSIFFTILNSLFIIFVYGSGIDFFFLSLAVFILRLFFYTIKIVFISFSKDLLFLILFLSFLLNVFINIVLKYAVR
ncbi:MAG: hypothetical protein ABIN00_02085 [candidate division WOR-3 bacterium]